MTLKRKQHILPESYMMNWVDPATTVPNKTPMVWIISQDIKSKCAKPPAAGFFWRDYFYDLITQSGGRRQDLENLLGKIEGAVADITRRCIVARQPLTQEEAQNLDLFVACMFMRTERMKESIESAASATARIERENASFHGHTVPDTSVYEHNAHPFSIYDGILFMADHLGKMSHNIFVAQNGKSFLTSDTPCLWQAAHGPPGLLNPRLGIFLALTPMHMLHISKLIPTSSFIEADNFWVDQANFDTIQNCRKYFIANSSVIEPAWQQSIEDRLKALLDGAIAMG